MNLSPDQKFIALYKENEIIYIHKTTDYRVFKKFTMR